MSKKFFLTLSITFFAIIFQTFSQNTKIIHEQKEIAPAENSKPKVYKSTTNDSIMKSKINEYAKVKLTTDIKKLTENEKQLIRIFIEISKIMDELYWLQTWGDPNPLLEHITNEYDRQFVMINYGPWDRLDNNKPFLADNFEMKSKEEKNAESIPVQAKDADKMKAEEAGITDDWKKKWGGEFSKKPLGANFYPDNMTKSEFENFNNSDKTSLYTLIRRNEKGDLEVVWYNEAYNEQLAKASELLIQASDLSDDKELGNYLKLRAEALLSNNYQPSDMAWMDMKNNHLDFVVGPIENYEDALFEYKAAFEAFVLVKDMDWSKKLEKYIAFLPGLQKQLPVKEEYKKEEPGTSSDLGVYDAIYYAGDCNAGSKTIAINLPNDEEVQLKKGSRRLQLKNTMQAKFDNILVPIANKLIDPSQLKNIKFDAFFNNVMFHEVAHGLGIKNTINGKGTVRESLRDVYSAFEEAKADILGLFMVTNLIANKEVTGLKIEDCYITYMAGIFRSVRFGAASSHGKANMMCFNFFEKAQAFNRNPNGTYVVNVEKMKKAVNDWASTILTFQGNGDYEGASKYLKDNAVVSPQLKKELDGLKLANIPKDIVFDQGAEALGF